MSSIDGGQGYYAGHLAEVNKTNAVRITADICNEKGMVIVLKGTPLTHEIAEKIARFRLLSPLENSIDLDNPMTPKRMQQDVVRLVDEYQKVGASPIDDVQEALKVQLMGVHMYPLLTQKLTVMAQRLPTAYKDSLITAVVGLRIARQLHLDEESLQVVFIGSLMHDAGLLNINPDVVNKEGALTAVEWKTLQAHVPIGRYFADLVPGLNKKVGRAIFEHHERINGTGYPLGRSKEKLSLEGQIIAIADTASAIFHNKLMPRGYQVKDCVPIMQMTGHVYPQEVHNALMRVLHDNQHAPSRALKDDAVPKQVQYLLVSQKAFSHWFSLAEDFLQEKVINAGVDTTNQVSYMLVQLEKTIRSSGLFSADLRDWLINVYKTKRADSFQEVEYTALMFDELGFQLKQMHRLATTAVANNGDQQTIERAAELGQLLDSFPVPQWNS